MRSRESARTVTSVPALKLLARWARGLDPRLLDGCLALALAGWVLAELPRLSEHTRPAVLVVMTLSIAFRRRWPLAVLAVVLACVLLNSGGDVGLAGLAAIVIAAYSAALHSVRRWPVAILLLATAAAAAVSCARRPGRTGQLSSNASKPTLSAPSAPGSRGSCTTSSPTASA